MIDLIGTRLVKMFLHTTVIAFAVILGSFVSGDDTRYKRVINGVGLNGRPSTYTAIRYYGVMTSIWYNYYHRKIAKLWADYGYIYCSGSLLTPKIFGTACHCVTKVVLVPNPRSPKSDKRIAINDQWAGRATIFFGVSNRYGEESMETYSPVLTKRFIIHQKCERLGAAVAYDYAIVQLPYEWIKADDTIPYPWTEMEYAPTYSVKTIRDFYYYAPKKELVCFHVGYGTYIQDDAKNILSDFLRTGWGVLIPQDQCYFKFFRRFGVVIPLEKFTFACDDRFPKHNQPTGKADSGGPITCQNKLFAIVAGADKAYSVNSPIYMNLFVYATEYREDLIHSVDDLQGTYKDFVDNYYKTTTIRPRPGFVLKMHDTPVLGPEKTVVPLTPSQGQALAASARIATLQRGCTQGSYAGLFALNIVVSINTLL